MRFKAVTVGMVLVGTALGSHALTLGRARGAAWIGQPLELNVPVQIDPGAAEGTLCPEADVFHGDSRQDSSRVQVQVQSTDQPDSFNLKITSTSLIDEPVVTVYLRAGCGQKSSRKYVLLADYPNDAVAPLSRSAAPTVAPVPLVIPTEAATNPPARAAVSAETTLPSTASPARPKAPAAREAAKEVPAEPKPAAREAAKEVTKELPREVAKEPVKEASKEAAKEPVKPVAKEAPKKEAVAKAEKTEKTEKAEKADKPAEASKPAASGKPRLRLDPIEVLNERVKNLESNSAATVVQDDLNRDGQKMQALQSDLKTLLDQAVKNEASLMAMRERLEKAESERVPLTVVYALAALVVLCLTALAYLLFRRPRQPAWENSYQASAAYAPASVAPAQAASAGQMQDMDVNLVDLDQESFDQLMGQPQASKTR